MQRVVRDFVNILGRHVIVRNIANKKKEFQAKTLLGNDLVIENRQ